ncbi:unnamed protein product [Linum trigynum]|uniref:Alpha/beta hydrolase fold-3 domain-containing protein n=1 Tax=Linum trigynum TaxID=586398 RepID=A0AAV2ETY9_9ROSI
MSTDIAQDFSPLIRIYKDGRVERLLGTATLPAGHDPTSGVVSKDIVYSTQSTLSARLYAPPSAISAGKKLPLLIYIHGGGFCIESPFSPIYHAHLNALVAEAQIVAVSVDYRLVPEHPLPCAYDDCWAALKWAVAHAGGSGPEEWLNACADFGRVFVAGDSAGANIAHRVAMRNAEEKLIELWGLVLVDPYFWGEDQIGDEPKDEAGRALPSGLWRLANPGSKNGLDDPEINATADPKLSGLGCRRVLVLVAEKDSLKDRGRLYCETLGKNGWPGKAEIHEAKGENHVFHLFDPACENAAARMKRTVSFLNEGKDG